MRQVLVFVAAGGMGAFACIADWCVRGLSTGSCGGCWGGWKRMDGTCRMSSPPKPCTTNPCLKRSRNPARSSSPPPPSSPPSLLALLGPSPGITTPSSSSSPHTPLLPLPLLWAACCFLARAIPLQRECALGGSPAGCLLKEQGGGDDGDGDAAPLAATASASSASATSFASTSR